ncbi:MAG: helix-turn-helix domain-containing protein, partial [Myxococcales bacterium]|nr:helix-turn-helix domain-containing protein [Myxococcales bacterium]
MPNFPSRIDIANSPEYFPITALIAAGLWPDLTPPAKALLPVLWDFHREYPDACHPNRKTLARLSGISPPSVSNALTVLEDIGIVQTIQTPGPRPNTYKLKWTNLRAPKKAAADTGSPYRRPSADWELHMGTDAEGHAVAKYERKGGGLHRMSDGCFIRGQVEMVIHDLLVAWGVPHWSEVGYCDLGIKLRHAKSGDLNRQATVDFVVAPGLLVERLGLPATQGSAKKYRAKSAAKMKAARKAGWTVLTIEPDQRPGDWLLEPIRKAWADATIDEATRLRRLLQGAGKHEESHGPSRKLDAHIEDAKARLAGKKEPRKSRGLTMQKRGEHGFPVTYRCDPIIVL